MRFHDFEYTETRRMVYGDGATFLPVCPVCGRYVKADKTVKFNGLEEYVPGANATCSKCGRVEMPFEGFIDYGEAVPL